MAIIDPDGLFNGERLQRCSDEARKWWPYLFLWANGYGRFEISYRKIAGAVFSTFSSPPSEEDFLGLIQEYREEHLLFLYQSGRQIWGQWWCKDKSLPRYKTAADRNSPEPPEPEYSKWVRSYNSEIKPLPKTFVNIPKCHESLRKSFCQGVGDGVGVGDGIPPMPPKGGELALFPVPESPPKDWRAQKFSEFWDVVWTKVGKDAAWRVWKSKLAGAGAQQVAEQIIAGAIRDGPRLMREAQERGGTPLQPRTYISQGRYLDEPVQFAKRHNGTAMVQDDRREVLIREAREKWQEFNDEEHAQLREIYPELAEMA